MIKGVCDWLIRLLGLSRITPEINKKTYMVLVSCGNKEPWYQIINGTMVLCLIRGLKQAH